MEPRVNTFTHYQQLANFRHAIRAFLRIEEEAARSFGIEPRQYFLLLTIKGLSPEQPRNIKTLADLLQLKHHSVVELANRLIYSGFVKRARSPTDKREVLLHLTPEGEDELEQMASFHNVELETGIPHLCAALAKIAEPETSEGATA